MTKNRAMDFSASALKVLHPREVFSRFALAGARPDGRSLADARKIGVSPGTLSTCDGSAVVRLGGTTVAAGVQVVLATSLPRGVLVEPPPAVQVGLQISPASSSRFRRSGFSDPSTGRSACIAQMVSNILRLSAVLDEAQLRVDDTTSFRLEVDAVCTTFDGNVEDAAILAVVCAVSTTVLPALLRRADGSWVLAASAQPSSTAAEVTRPAGRVHLSCLPVPLSFACIRLAAAKAAADFVEGHGELRVVADPTADEEALGSGTATFVAAISLGSSVPTAPPSRLLLLQATGDPLDESQVRACMQAAFDHAGLRSTEIRAAVAGVLGTPTAD